MMKVIKGFAIGFVVISVLFSIPSVRLWMIGRILIPAISPRIYKNEWESKLVLNEFYVQSKSKNYNQAHLLLSNSLRGVLTVQSLKQQWQTFEHAHGSIRNWQSAPGGKSSVWPDHVDFNHTVTGTKSGAGKVSVRMVPENGTWRISQLRIWP